MGAKISTVSRINTLAGWWKSVTGKDLIPVQTKKPFVRNKPRLQK